VEREILSTPDPEVNWPSGLTDLLDSYLRKVGIVDANVRARWVAQVLSGLTLHIGEFAADDIVELAVERLRDAVYTRLAKVANLNPIREGNEIAAVLVVLQDARYANLIDAVFENCESEEVPPEVREQLRVAVEAGRPRPVPVDAPLEVPIQRIELPSLSPLRRVFGGPR
jgi:hypothetical protein